MIHCSSNSNNNSNSNSNSDDDEIAELLAAPFYGWASTSAPAQPEAFGQLCLVFYDSQIGFFNGPVTANGANNSDKRPVTHMPAVSGTILCSITECLSVLLVFRLSWVRFD
jgi:hypothetical protein